MPTIPSDSRLHKHVKHSTVHILSAVHIPEHGEPERPLSALLFSRAGGTNHSVSREAGLTSAGRGAHVRLLGVWPAYFGLFGLLGVLVAAWVVWLHCGGWMLCHWG
jgi:hypothetical protein